MTKLAYLGAWRTRRATVKERGRARNMLGLTHNSGAITKPGGLFCQFQMSCHLQHFNSAPGISLARSFSASAAVLALLLLLFWCWFAFCLGPFLVVMFGLLVEMFMKQLGPRRRRTRTMSGWVRNDCKRNFKDAPSCQLSPFLSLSLSLSFIPTPSAA